MNEFTIPGMIAAAWAGFLLGRRWADVRVRLARFGLIDTGRPARLVPREFRRGPAPVVVQTAAWNAHLLYFARQCAPLARISEGAIESAGIVDRVTYRRLAPLMRHCGLWVQATGPGGQPGKNRWGEWPPYPAIGRVRDAMRAGRLHLPYPDGRPPAIRPRR